jgi:hypothetical protein
MSFFSRLFEGFGRTPSQDYKLPQISKTEWPGYTASLLEHHIANAGFTALPNTAVFVDKRNNGIGLCTEADGSPPDLSGDPAVAAYCLVGDAPFFPKAKTLIEGLLDSGFNHPVPRTQVVDQLAWSVVSVLEQKLTAALSSPD